MGGFNRDDRKIPRPKINELKPKPPDRSAARVAYRDAYHRAQQSGVPLVSLPEPDAAGETELDEAMARLGELAGWRKIKAVPPIDIQS